MPAATVLAEVQPDVRPVSPISTGLAWTMSPYLGTWIGDFSRRPLILHIEPRNLESLAVTGELYQGREVQAFDLTASFAPDGALLLSATDPQLHFEGRVSGGVLSGTWNLRDGARERTWSASRNQETGRVEAIDGRRAQPSRSGAPRCSPSVMRRIPPRFRL